MYKIYINDTPLILTTLVPGAPLPPSTENQLFARYSGAPKTLFSYADTLEKPNRWESITLLAADYPKLVADFFSHYQLIEAAGGIVRNDTGKVLLIHRRGYWDLPKGKIDPGESPPQAALREIEEETGLYGLQLGAALPDSYHTYRDKGQQRILKKTYWFQVTCPDQIPHPQAEEDIERAEWVDLDTFLATNQQPIYRNIVDVLTAYRQQKLP